MSKILIVDDERTARKGLTFILNAEIEEIYESESAEQAEELLRNNEFDLVIVDLRLPTEEIGLNLIQFIRQAFKLTPVLVMTAFGSVDSAVKAMKAGAGDYITKDFTKEEILLKINRLIETRQLWLANYRLINQVKNLKKKYGQIDHPIEIIGESELVKQILNIIARVGQDNDSTVLITGESGTGKELIARSVHLNSPSRCDNEFVVVDVANMPSTLLESQLFGHEKGSFTSAHQQHIGFFESANGGTVFLDEIGDFPMELQIKLLRFLQEKEFVRVGGSKTLYSDVRIIAATNKNLEDMVKKNLFREDLYYRLNVVRIYVPALRERKDDIAHLVKYFQKILNQKKQRKLDFPKNVMDKLKDYDWPGNIRQLKNLMESLYVICPSTVVKEGDIVFDGTVIRSKTNTIFDSLKNLPLKEARRKLIDQFEMDYLSHYLKINNGNISKIATDVGESREGLSKKIKRYGLKSK